MISVKSATYRLVNAAGFMGVPSWIAAIATILRYCWIVAGLLLARIFYGPWHPLGT